MRILQWGEFLRKTDKIYVGTNKRGRAVWRKVRMLYGRRVSKEESELGLFGRPEPKGKKRGTEQV